MDRAFQITVWRSHVSHPILDKKYQITKELKIKHAKLIVAFEHENVLPSLKV